MATNGKAVRAKLRAVALAFIPGLTAATAFDHVPHTFGGASPALAIKMARRNRDRVTADGSGGVFYPELHLLALYADADGNYTEADAEDVIDEMEAGAAALVDQCQITDEWLALDYAGDTTEDITLIEGDAYRRIVVPLMVVTLP